MKTMKLTGFALATVALGFGLMTACSSDDDNNNNIPLPPIGGYNNAGEVGKADLLAYWPLNGSGVESKSNTAPSTTVGTSWVAGPKGQAANFTNGYMKYPSIAALTSNLNAFTISAWVKVKNNQTPTSGSVSTIFTMSRPNEWEGNINLYVETGQRPAMTDTGVKNDSIVFKGGFRSSVSGGQAYDNILHLETWMAADNLLTPGKHVASPNVVADTWAQAVVTWDGTTHKLLIYSNGQKINNPAFEVRGDNTSIIFDTPSSPVIGAFGNVETTTDTWNKAMTGQVDEIRVWKKALTASDIGSLYSLEKAGR